MKFLNFAMYDVAKAAEVAQAADKAMASAPSGFKVLADYVCEGLAFPGVPANTIVGFRIVEAESNEAIAAAAYPIVLAGATLWYVPILEMPTGGTAEVEKKYKG